MVISCPIRATTRSPSLASGVRLTPPTSPVPETDIGGQGPVTTVPAFSATQCSAPASSLSGVCVSSLGLAVDIPLHDGRFCDGLPLILLPKRSHGLMACGVAGGMHVQRTAWSALCCSFRIVPIVPLRPHWMASSLDSVFDSSCVRPRFSSCSRAMCAGIRQCSAAESSMCRSDRVSSGSELDRVCSSLA